MDYKSTILLPKTDFPMRAELPKREPALLERWQQERIYDQIRAARKGAPPFIFHLGPPFANGDAHIGHVLTFTLKDIVAKSKVMSGFDVPFIPGWDCHGLPIEHKVMVELKDQADDAVLIREKCAAMAQKYIGIQKAQFQRLGVMADWDQPYITMEPGYEADVLRTFATIVGKDLVYQGLRPVSWSTGCQTALAEAEVEYQQKTDAAVFVKFRLTDESAVKLSSTLNVQRSTLNLLIWTTTPWTLPANLAVAVSASLHYGIYQIKDQTLIVAEELLGKIPDFAEAVLVGEKFKGEQLIELGFHHPFLERQGKIYSADFVTADAGTGLVHIAPGHGADDYFLGMQHGLKPLSPVDDRGCMTVECGVPELVGQYVFKANPLIIDLLKQKGAFWAEEPYVHDYPYCWRSKTPIVFRSVKQWFIKVDAFRQQALDEIKKVKWIPAWGESRISGAIASRPDWCISRQRSWGIPIPVFYGEGEQALTSEKLIRAFADIVEKEGTDVWFKSSADELAVRLGLPKGLKKGKDTLDVWIDSGSSSAAVVKKRLTFPADLYLEGSDQHRGWFNSSLCLSTMTNGVAPYRSVLTHGFVVDEHGKKYSKSSGATDSTSLINEYGADVLRLWVAHEDYTKDTPFSKNILTRVADAYRSIRNALRILLANLSDFDPAKDAVPMEQWTELDRYMLAKLQEVIAASRKAYDDYEFHQVYHHINRFCAVELSALYIDALKDRMYCDAQNDPKRRAAQTVLNEIFEGLVKLLAPLIPFTAEEAWGFAGRKGSVHLQLFPEAKATNDPTFLARWEKLLALRSQVNEQLELSRQKKEIGKSLEARVMLSGVPESVSPALLAELFIVSQVEIGSVSSSLIQVTKAKGQKCERCWKYDEKVGTETGHPTLCPRCATVVRGLTG